MQIHITQASNGYVLQLSVETDHGEYNTENYVFTNRFDLIEFLEDTFTLADSDTEEEYFTLDYALEDEVSDEL